MAKRSGRQKVSAAGVFVKFYLVAVVVLLVGWGVKSVVEMGERRVLGTRALLARGGDDSGGGDNGGSSGSGGGGSSDSGSSENGSSGSGDSGGSGSSGSSGGGGSSGSSGGGSTSAPVVTRTETRVRVPTVTPKVEDSDETDEAEEEEGDTEVRTKTETRSGETRTEVRLSETERIRTRTKDGQTRIDITAGGIKTRFEVRDDRVVVKAEREDGTEVELEDETLVKIDDRLAKDNIKVTTVGGGRFVVQKGAVGAVTKFPVAVDLATNTLFVTTPMGQRVLTVLPEQAVVNMLAANVVSRLGGQAIVDEAVRGNLTDVNRVVGLGERNGLPVYEIAGISNQKLLGFIPVQISKQVAVSAETGEVVATDVSLGGKILDALAF